LSISHEDLAERWSLSFSDIEFITGKPTSARLGLAVQLKFFAAYGFFAQDHSAIPADGVSCLAEQLGFDADAMHEYDFAGRTARRHCAEMKRADREELTLWIACRVVPDRAVGRRNAG